MAVLWVHEGYQRGFDRKIKSYTDELEDIQGRYTSALNLIGSYGGSNVSNCDIYLRKRKKALSEKIQQAENIRKKVHTYASNVLTADQNIAGSIHNQSYSFYQAKGIGPQSDTAISRAWNTITTTASDFWRDAKGTAREIVADIKEFYEENRALFKYIINLALDALALSAALALFALSGGTLFGIICGIGALWATGKALYETVTDVMALSAHLSGDEARAEELSEKTLTQTMIGWGEALDKKWGTHFMETSMKVLTIGLEGCEFVASLVLIYESFKKIFFLQDCASLQLNKCGKRTWNQNMTYLRNIKWGGTKQLARLANPVNWAKFILKNLGFAYAKDAKTLTTLFDFDNLKKNISTIKDIKNGKSLLKLNPVTKTALDYAEKITDILLA